MPDLSRIASTMGGEVRGNAVTFPTPGHSKVDRGTVAKLAPDAPDGLLVHSFNGGDPLAIKNELRAKGLLPSRDRSGTAWRVSGSYEFKDECGNVLYRTLRHEHPVKPKRYSAERPDGRGGWVKGLGDVQRTLYRLPDLLAADPAEPVYLVEGERKADKLNGWGLVATSIAFGAKSWSKQYAALLADRAVVILPDNDQPGREFAENARRDIEAEGRPAVILDLPGLGPGEDIMEWTGNAIELRQLTAQAIAGKPPGSAGPAFKRGISARALMALEFAPIRWTVPGYVPEGLLVLAGAPKLGKSWLALDLMVAVASGGVALGSIPCEQGDVLGLMLEDNQRRLQRRLRQMQPDKLPDRLTLATEWPTLDDGCCNEIDAWIASAEKPRLIVIDVYARVKGGKGRNETDYDSDYRQAAMLQAIASRNGLAVVLIHHTRKMTADDPFDEVSGTRGLTGAADSVLVLKREAGSQTPVLYGRGRDLEEVETALEFEKETGAWSILGAAWQVADTSERREVQLVLFRSVDPMTPTEIAARLGKSRQNIQKMVRKMVEDGQVEQVSRGNYRLVSMVSPVAAVPHRKETKETGETTLHARAGGKDQ